MNPRAPFFAVIFVVAIFFTQSVLAHAPFDGSTRVVLHDDSVEVLVTAGAGLADKFLAGENINARQLGVVGRPTSLPASSAEKFIKVAADGKMLAAESVAVATDGLEFQFTVKYPPARATSLAVEPLYLNSLPVPQKTAVALTDETGNILGSAMITPGHEFAAFELPAKFAAVETNLQSVAASASSATSNMVAEKINPPAPSRPGFMEFLHLGVFHILNVEAFDHLLFLTALLLGCRSLKTMLLVITGFTLAHSLTLALAALNLVTISPRIIEPLIAVSIIFVAAENFRCTDKSGVRYALTCGFGLIHGFGFANALRTTGLGGNGTEIAMPLFAFNLGVEIGQLIVAAVLLPALFLLRKISWFEKYGVRVISALVILLAAFWVWQRVTIFGD